MAKTINLAVTIDGARVTIEFPTEVYGELIGAFVSPSAHPILEKMSAKPAHGLDALPRSERDFVAEKKPRGHGETVAVLAFCLRESGTLEFTADDMRRAYIRAAVRPPKVVAQALRDAKNKYELIETGSKKSTFRLSAHGERTVLFDLPRAK